MTREARKEASVGEVIAGGGGPATGSELVAAGATLVRLENTTQMAIAVQRPRDNKAILAEALEALEMSPILVEQAIYSKPVGKDPDTGQMKYAEGLSIRSAEELRRIYGNNSCGASVIGERGEEIQIGAVFVDMEKNTRFALETNVSKFYTSKTGQVVQHKPDRLHDVVVKAKLAILERDVTLSSLPAWLKMEFEAKARELASKGKLPALRKRMLSAFASLAPPVSEAMILKHLEVDHVDKITREHIVTLKGLHTAILEGSVSAKETFGIEDRKSGGEPGRLPLNPKA